MMSRRDAAIALDIPVEMAKKHNIPSKISEQDLRALQADPPAWLIQSRANRKPGARPVWVQLTCEVCGAVDFERPKKWWPEFSFAYCERHSPAQLSKPAAGITRVEYPQVSARMIGVVEEQA